MKEIKKIELPNIMACDLTLIFKEYVNEAEKKFSKNIAPKLPQANSNNVTTDFKTQSVKLLESIFSLRSLLEALHEEYTSLTSFTDESGERCFQMELNSSDMMKLCRECLDYIKSPKYISPDLPRDIRLHREAVTQMLAIYMKSCEDLSKENSNIKRARKQMKRTKLRPEIDEPVDTASGSVNCTDSDFCPQDLEMMQINTEGVFRRLNADLAEKEAIERQILQIGKMNQTLAENVLEQHQMINQLEISSGHSNLNVEYGNDQIKRAMQNQSNTRFWIIFILLVLSLTLIFIDWYRT